MTFGIGENKKIIITMHTSTETERDREQKIKMQRIETNSKKIKSHIKMH